MYSLVLLCFGLYLVYGRRKGRRVKGKVEAIIGPDGAAPNLVSENTGIADKIHIN